METEANLHNLFFGSDPIQAHAAGLIAGFVLLLLLTWASALIAGAEVAFITVAQSYRNKQIQHKRGRLSHLLGLIENLEQLRISLWLSGIFFKIAVFITASTLTLIITQSVRLSTGIALLIAFGMAMLFVIIAEILPKSYATAKPEKFSLGSVHFIRVILFIFKPLSVLFSFISNKISKKAGIDPKSLFANEISSAIENAPDVFTDEEDILKGIVKFGNIDVSEILKPRVDVVALDYHALLGNVLSVVIESGYSRIPVYEGNFDNIRGILYVKDLLPHIDKKDTFKWQTLIRPSYFVPDSKKVKELLTEFQSNKIHMAVIVDEYGGTIGIVTLEDIIEEIVGEISDESDEDEKYYTQVNENTYIFDGKVLLNDFHKILQTDSGVFDDIKGDADTLAGLILEIRGEIPMKNEEIRYKQFVFKIEAADTRRIKQIRVSIDNTLQED